MFQDHLDTLAFSHEMYDQASRAMAFQASTNAEAEGWQRDLRAKLAELLGGFPESRCELLPRITETKQFSTYTRETVLFQSRPNMTVFGYLLMPKDFETPGPTILCLHGHGRGVDDIVGIQEDGTMRTEYGEYQTILRFSVLIKDTLRWQLNSSDSDIVEMMRRVNGEPATHRVCPLPGQHSYSDKR